LYALLIGIDRYGEGIEPLEGCENDVRAMQDFLRRQLNFNGHSYQIMTLLNEKATKENVERSIEELLSRAGEGEEVLFYFAGYGDIDESVLLQKLPFQDPLRKLVLFIEGDFFFSDFSNGEIGDLVRQMDRQGALLSIVVDAGYAAQKGASETNTKGRHLRTIDLPARIEENPNPFDQRPIDTEMPFFEFYAAKTRNTSTEMLLGEEMRGVFTYSLIESLRQKKGEHNIREIQADIQNRMSLRAASPDPDFYIEHWNREDEPQFLGGMLAHLGASYEIRFVPEQSAWRLDAGYRDGLRSRHPVTGEMSLFDVFEEGVPPEAMAEGQGQIGQVGAETVRARSSWVAPLLKFSLNPEIKYVARLNRLPIERLRYFVDEPSFLESELPSFPKELENYLETDRERESQLYLLAEGDPKRANYVLKAEGQKVSLNHKRDLNRPILLPNLFNEFRQNPYARMQRELVHLSKWENILNLSNPNSRIDEKELGLELISTRDDSPIPIDSNAFVHDVISPQQIRIRVHNQSTQGLYFGLLYLSADLAVSPIPMSEGGSFLEAGQSIMAIDGETATLNFSRRQQEMGQTEATDYFILIASSDPFRPQVLEMLDIDRQSERQPERNIVNWTNTHSLLFDESEGRYQDWNTRLYRVNMSFNPTVE
ncbi:MAG: caspase family protein, partial [Bacteroidota bacterium]